MLRIRGTQDIYISRADTANIGFNMPDSTIPYIGAISFAVFAALYFLSIKNYRR